MDRSNSATAPYTFVVLAILILVMGGAAIFRTPADIFPNSDIPVVSIIWSYNGLVPKEMSAVVNSVLQIMKFITAKILTVPAYLEMLKKSLNGTPFHLRACRPGFLVSVRLSGGRQNRCCRLAEEADQSLDALSYRCVAWDNSGNVYSSSRILRSTYKFTYFDCPPKGTDPCRPGFNGDSLSPQQDAYTGNSFTLMANILENPRPITTMKAYIDNTLVATANGPTMTSPVENAPNGTHILTFQAWDTGGVMYRIQYNINLNVPH